MSVDTVSCTNSHFYSISDATFSSNTASFQILYLFWLRRNSYLSEVYLCMSYFMSELFILTVLGTVHIFYPIGLTILISYSLFALCIVKIYLLLPIWGHTNYLILFCFSDCHLFCVMFLNFLCWWICQFCLVCVLNFMLKLNSAFTTLIL